MFVEIGRFSLWPHSNGSSRSPVSDAVDTPLRPLGMSPKLLVSEEAAETTDESRASVCLQAHLQERTETLAAEKTDLQRQLTDLQRQLSASQAELAACFGTLEEATTTPARPDHGKPEHLERARHFNTFNDEPAPKPEADDAVELTKHAHRQGESPQFSQLTF